VVLLRARGVRRRARVLVDRVPAEFPGQAGLVARPAAIKTAMSVPGRRPQDCTVF